MKIRIAAADDVDAIVGVHIAAFPGFFLTSLGKHFLGELYLGFLKQSSGILLVAENGGSLVGFAAGTTMPDSFFKVLRKTRGIFFLLKAIPAMLQNPLIVLRKVYSAIFYRGDSPTELNGGALLSSIGVLPEVLGSSLGRQLLTGFELEAASRDSKFVYLTTDAVGNERVNNFYRKCGYREESRFNQQAIRPMLRYIKDVAYDPCTT